MLTACAVVCVELVSLLAAPPCRCVGVEACCGAWPSVLSLACFFPFSLCIPVLLWVLVDLVTLAHFESVKDMTS